MYLPLTASGALFLSTAPLPGCPAGTNGSPPLKDLKRPKVSATYLTHHPARTPIPVGATVSGRAGGAGRGCHCCPSPYLLVTGHTTQEPSQAHTVLQTWCQGRQAQVSQGPPPQIWKEAGIWAFSGSVCPSLSHPLSPCSALHLTLHIFLHLT